MTGLGALIKTVGGTTLDSVPIVGDVIEIGDALTDIRKKGVINTGIRMGLGLVPNGPWTSWLEGSARATSGGMDGWEATVADWITGGKEEAPKQGNIVDLSKKERKHAAEMAKETVEALRDGEDIKEIIAEKMEEINKIKDPANRAAMMAAYSQMAQIEVDLAVSKDGKISKEEYAQKQQLQAAMGGVAGVQLSDAKEAVPGAGGKSDKFLGIF